MKEMFSIGMFHAFFSTEAWQITIPLWICVIAGFVIQYILLKKVKSYFKWIFVFILGIAVITLEGLSHIITGWDLFGLLIIYGGVFAVSIGVILAIIVNYIKNKRKP
ncbi:MAG: hypothetical protein IJO47_01965 [Clostridia bacterium]|nr:hypothetical protein [Clostridia bacterium]